MTNVMDMRPKEIQGDDLEMQIDVDIAERSCPTRVERNIPTKYVKTQAFKAWQAAVTLQSFH